MLKRLLPSGWADIRYAPVLIERVLEWYERKAGLSLASRGVSGSFEIIVRKSIQRRRADLRPMLRTRDLRPVGNESDVGRT